MRRVAHFLLWLAYLIAPSEQIPIQPAAIYYHHTDGEMENIHDTTADPEGW